MFGSRRKFAGIGFIIPITVVAMVVFPGATVTWAADFTSDHFSSYRGLRLGMSLADAATQAGTQPAETRTLHKDPALIQELDWQPRSGDSSPGTDSVRDGVLSFYNGQLSRILVTYDRYQVEGMTAADVIEGISARYGTATFPNAAVIAHHSAYGETVAVLARWEDADSSYNLVRIGDRSGFSLILLSKRLDPLAEAATTEAVRLETMQAPQREAERQKKRDAEVNRLLEDARSANKPKFRP